MSDSFKPLIESNKLKDLCQNLQITIIILRSVYYSQNFTDICILYDVLFFFNSLSITRTQKKLEISY